MSDFLYSSQQQSPGQMAAIVRRIYPEQLRPVKEFHGRWGSLAVSKNHYNGFDAVETETYICAVAGGPLLTFCDNQFLAGLPSSVGTHKILSRWKTSKEIVWDEDLSGPFAIILIDKINGEIETVTDLMSFIPLFKTKDKDTLYIGSHADIVSEISQRNKLTDVVSIADFVLNGFVTYPFTFYKDIEQMPPASVTRVSLANINELISSHYWIPNESYSFDNIEDASLYLRNGLTKYIEQVTASMSHIALFISGGEDSRAILAMTPERLKRDAYVFLDGFNAEAKVAKKIAAIYGASFHYCERSPTHYLDNLAPCSRLTGSGAQFHHVHSYGFHKSCNLDTYQAVLGGFSSDALLKCSHQPRRFKSNKFPELVQIPAKSGFSIQVENSLFHDEILESIGNRRAAHMQFIRQFRGESAEEWFELWPASMNMNIPNLHGNRRLFRSYEPFMSTVSVKVSASVPQRWKTNRRLFHKTMQPLFKPSRGVLHADGWLPYWPWWANVPLKLTNWLIRTTAIKLGIINRNQGPWWDWQTLWSSSIWKMRQNEMHLPAELLGTKEPPDPQSPQLSNMQKLNLLQVDQFFKH